MKRKHSETHSNRTCKNVYNFLLLTFKHVYYKKITFAA